MAWVEDIENPKRGRILNLQKYFQNPPSIKHDTPPVQNETSKRKTKNPSVMSNVIVKVRLSSSSSGGIFYKAVKQKSTKIVKSKSEG